ncbi:MAG: flagellar motor protein [Xenococcaceae cyanobacterium MO_188.B19]|nr:flagellar motor protein [Xenococcaceae cyanobacterium MO_188.B19]
MKRSLKYRNNGTESLNLWPSFTDLMANAFMIISLFLLLALFKSLFLKYTADETEIDLTQTEREVRILKRQLALLDNRLSQKTQENENLKSELGQSIDDLNQFKKGALALQNQLQLSNNQLQLSNSQINDLEIENKKLKSAPPVVVIQDSGEYRFASGSAALPSQLKKYISNDLVKRIEAISKQRNLYVVEIIGHTDGQVNYGSGSNLDENLEAVAQGNKDIKTLVPGSNADLGLMRALEVVKQLQLAQKSGRLQGVKFRAYSAAQLQLPSGDFATANRKPNASRRRIEIRFSPLGRAETIR